MYDITALDVQKEINRYSVGHSPKTVYNFHGFISPILGMFRPNLKLNTTLPQKVKNEPYIPFHDKFLYDNCPSFDANNAVNRKIIVDLDRLN